MLAACRRGKVVRLGALHSTRAEAAPFHIDRVAGDLTGSGAGDAHEASGAACARLCPTYVTISQNGDEADPFAQQSAWLTTRTWRQIRTLVRPFIC